MALAALCRVERTQTINHFASRSGGILSYERPDSEELLLLGLTSSAMKCSWCLLIVCAIVASDLWAGCAEASQSGYHGQSRNNLVYSGRADTGKDLQGHASSESRSTNPKVQEIKDALQQLMAKLYGGSFSSKKNL
ncbi:uncharacterized protein LOC142817767 isoform X2 [Rhipicephalus microplus]|uniref:uncharacterized protein LOC142817767 isoform X2 n=1 Tax=Rhipicephalus microplus TaxID=6941 RepID=UPI003F6CCD68